MQRESTIPTSGAEEFHYKAFISYSHKDQSQARRLHRRLENYRLPKWVRDNGHSLRPIFRDKDDLEASSVLDDALKNKLRVSENLIVLCSPNAAQSKWVDQEIRFFKSLGRANRIFAIIIAGHPFAERSGLESALECFPKSLRYEVDSSGQMSESLTEPLAADIRRKADGVKLATTKLVSGLLNLGLDKLVRRDIIKTRTRMAAVITVSSVVISMLSALTWTAYTSQNEAMARKAEAENFVEFMLSDLRTELETYGRLDLMESVGEKANTYYDKFHSDEFDANENGRRARTLQFIGEIKYSLGKVIEADGYFQRSYDITKAAISSERNSAERVREHAVSAHLQSLIFRSQKDYDNEALFLKEYEIMSRKLIALDENSLDAVRHLARAKTNLGRVEMKMGKNDMARRHFEDADKILSEAADISREITTTLRLTENLSWLAETYRIEERHKLAYDIRRRQSDVLDVKYRATPNDFRLLEANIYAKLGLGNAARYMNDFGEAVTYHGYALREATRALKLEPEREKMMRAKVSAYIGLMQASLESGDAKAYRTYRANIDDFLEGPLVKAVQQNPYWRERLPAILADYDRKNAKFTRSEKI